MRIAVDASAVGPAPSGARTRMIALLEAYARAASTHELVVFATADSGLPSRLERSGVACVEVAPPPSPPVRLVRGTGTWRRRLAEVGAEAFSAETLPPPGALGVPTAVTIHDLRDLAPGAPRLGARRLYARHLLPAALRRVDRVVAVSEWTKGEVARRLRFPAERIDVVRNGVEVPALRPDPSAVEAWRRARGATRRPVLALGHLEPRKNLATLIDAVRALRASGRDDVGVVLAGRDEAGEGARLRRRAAAAPVVPLVLTGPLDEGERLLALAGAASVATPSALEGFGMVPLEAMAAGVPTVSSSAGALPEVVGDAGLLVAPDDVEGWAEAIGRLLDDDRERERLVAAGRARAATFSWDDAARNLVRAHDALQASTARR
ncbi:MAG: glycosyltransferase family 4 protein [Planctomycetota bacterium JB042]